MARTFRLRIGVVAFNLVARILDRVATMMVRHLVVEVIPTPMMDQVGQASDRASSRA